jgi:hypothetical protein
MFGTLFRSKCGEFNAKALAARLHLYRAVVKSLRSSYGSTQIAQVDSFVEELAVHARDESRSVWPRG